MNLHGIVAGAIQGVNPSVPATVKVSAGITVADDGTPVPAYSTIAATAQVQALTFTDLRQLDGLNLNGTRRAIYLYGEFDGTVRLNQKGGDLITLVDGPNVGTWLVAYVLEQWPNWCKVAVTLQDQG